MFPTTEIEYKRVNLLRQNFERRYAILFHKNIRDMFDAVARAINETNYTTPPLSVVNDGPIRKTFVSLYQTVGTHFAKESYNNIKARSDDEIVDKWMEYMKDFANTRADINIKSITSVTKEQINDFIGGVVRESAENGWGADQTARYLKNALRDKGEAIATWRSKMIARTEVMSASNTGSLKGAQDLGVPMDKIWIATMDNRTRDMHVFMNGQKVDIYAKFDVGGALMDGPGDPNGGPENNINCRCTIAYKVKRDEVTEVTQTGQGVQVTPPRIPQSVEIPKPIDKPTSIISTTEEEALIKEKEWISTIDDKTKEVLNKYTRGADQRINKYLRQGINLRDQEEIDYLTKTLDKALSEAPKFDGMVYRGMEFKTFESYDQFMSTINVGGVFADRGFMSTTFGDDVARAFLNETNIDTKKILFKIKSKTGVPIQDISYFADEREVLFNLRSKFTITDIKYVQAEELAPTITEITLSEL